MRVPLGETALAAYGLARQLTGTPIAALVGGVGFALLPARLEPLFGGHPAGFALALVPAALWGLDVALTRGRLAAGVAGGLAVLALACVVGLMTASLPTRSTISSPEK